MTDVPSNLIPTRITQLPEYPGSSQAGYLPYVLDGTTYKVQFSNVASAGEVPPSRTLTAGTGLTGGGDLSANRVFAIANGGVGASQLDTTGVVAGVYGDGSNIPRVTVDANGRVTSVTTNPVVALGYVPDSRTVTAGTGLLGGGSLASDITISLNLASATPEALGSATAGVSTAAAREDHVHPAVDLSDTNETQGALPLGRGGTGDALSPVAGAVVYSTGTKFALTNPGIAGQVLTSAGTDEPVWTTITGAGTVTSVDASGGTTGLTFTGGPITVSGTLTLGGTLAVASGGTGATNATSARTNLSAAASGANSDITSLSGITGGISTADFVAFDTTNVTPPTLGQLAWNLDDGTLDVGLNGGVVLQTGQETLFYAKNTSGSSIPIGTPVMFTGTVGASGKLTFGLAVADGSTPAEYMMGVTAQTIANNDFGYVTSFGLVRGFDTSGTPYSEVWADGDLLYFDPAAPGGWTKVEPVAPNIHVPVAVVVSAASGGSGSIFVRMTLSQRLGELQDVIINGGGPAAGQVLIYDATQQRWENNTLTAGSNVTITNGDGTITIAASDQYVGTVTSVDASGGTTGLTFTGGPITSSGTLTLGGTLGVANGGTGLTATPTNGQLPIGNGTGYTLAALTAGTGVSVTNGAGSITIDNTAPDQTVVLTAGTGISVTGTYPSFTIDNTAPDQIVSLTGAGATSISGTYPNFTISSTAGTGTVTSVDVSGGTTGLTFSGGPVTSSGTITMAGTLAIASGGTNGSATPTAGAVAYGSGTAYAFTTAGTAGQVLLSNGSSAPSFGGIDGGTF